MLFCCVNVSAGKHIATSHHHLSLMATPGGMSYECEAPERISLISSDQKKTVVLFLSEVHIQPFDIKSDFVFSEGMVIAPQQVEWA